MNFSKFTSGKRPNQKSENNIVTDEFIQRLTVKLRDHLNLPIELQQNFFYT